MKAASIHDRFVAALPEAVGAVLDTLASDDDLLWPHLTWPAMRFDRGLTVGAAGGHAFVRYRVVEHEPGRLVRFRIAGPPGFGGHHWFRVEPDGDGTRITHGIDGTSTLRFLPRWLFVIRPLHDALIEDALDRAETAATGRPVPPRRWSLWVRILRRFAARRGGRGAGR